MFKLFEVGEFRLKGESNYYVILEPWLAVLWTGEEKMDSNNLVTNFSASSVVLIIFF